MDISRINDLISCPICFEIPQYKVFQCQRGHIICEQCSNNIRTCPQCRINLGHNKIRNVALENVLKELVSLGKRCVGNGVGTASNDQHRATLVNTRRGIRDFRNNTRRADPYQCHWCGITTFENGRYTCLCCRGVNCCLNCFPNISTDSFFEHVTCRPDHIFALITNPEQKYSLSLIMNERNGDPLVEVVPYEDGVTIEPNNCIDCRNELLENYICLKDPLLRNFCGDCYQTTSFFTDHENYFVKCINRQNTMLKFKYRFTEIQRRKWDQGFFSFSSASFCLYSFSFKLKKECLGLLIFLLCLLWLLVFGIVNFIYENQFFFTVLLGILCWIYEMRQNNTGRSRQTIVL